MDLKPVYTMLVEIDRTSMMLSTKFLSSSKTEPDERIAAAEAILMLQKDRKSLVAEIMKGIHCDRSI